MADQLSNNTVVSIKSFIHFLHLQEVAGGYSAYWLNGTIKVKQSYMLVSIRDFVISIGLLRHLLLSLWDPSSVHFYPWNSTISIPCRTVRVPDLGWAVAIFCIICYSWHHEEHLAKVTAIFLNHLTITPDRSLCDCYFTPVLSMWTLFLLELKIHYYDAQCFYPSIWNIGGIVSLLFFHFLFSHGFLCHDFTDRCEIWHEVSPVS